MRFEKVYKAQDRPPLNPAISSVSRTMSSRPISSYERLFAASSPALGTICQWMRLRCHEGKPYTQDELKRALLAVHRQIEPLQCVLSSADDNNILLSARPDIEPTLDCRKGEVSPEFLDQLASEEVTKGMGATPADAFGKALWRGIILEDGWVLLIFHHTICDGNSRKIFVDRLLEVLANPDAFEDSPKLKLQPDACHLIASKVANSEDTKEPCGGEKEPFVPCTPSWPSPDKEAPMDERHNHVCSTTIPNISTLRAKCKANKVSVTPVIIAAFALAVRRQMRIPPSEEVDMRQMSWGVDIRRHLSDSNIFGCYVFGYNAEAEAMCVKADDAVLPIAINIQKAMAKCSSLSVAHDKLFQTKIQMEQPMTPEALMPILSLINGPVQGRTGPLNVSNIGLVKGQSTCGKAHVDKLYSITSQTNLGTYAWMNTATINDNLFVTLASVRPTTSEERMKAMLDEFAQILTDV